MKGMNMTTTIEELKAKLAEAEAAETAAKAAVTSLRKEKTWMERNTQRIRARAFEIALQRWSEGNGSDALRACFAEATEQIRAEATSRTKAARDAKDAKDSVVDGSDGDRPSS